MSKLQIKKLAIVFLVPSGLGVLFALTRPLGFLKNPALEILGYMTVFALATYFTVKTLFRKPLPETADQP